MMTFYCYEELSYRVQQEVAERVKQTTAYEKYVKSFYKERLTEIIEQDFTESEVTANNTVIVYSLDDIFEGELEPWADVFKSIIYDLDNRKIRINILVDETNYNALHDFISAVTNNFDHMMQIVMDEVNSINPDMGQFLAGKFFTEDGREVEISFK